MLLAKYTWDIYLCHFTNLASHAVEERKAGGRPPRFLARAKKGTQGKVTVFGWFKFNGVECC